MDCPRCGSFCSILDEYCDCGFDLKAGLGEEPRDDDGTDREAAPEEEPGPDEVATVEPESLDRLGRRRFHFALAGFVLCFLPVASWWAALEQPKTDSTPWRRRLFVLAVVDTLVFVCFVVAGARMTGGKERGASSGPPRIGVTLGPIDPGDGLDVVAVVPGSPAERAGLRAGDRITRVDDSPVDENERLSELIAEPRGGRPHKLRVRRGSSTFDVSVVPVLGLKSARRASRPLFASVPVGRSWWVLRGLHARDFAELLPLLVLAAVAWRRGLRLRPLASITAAILGAVLVLVLVAVAFQKLAAVSVGAILVANLASGLALLAFALIAMRVDPPAPVEAWSIPPLRTLPAFGLGVFYVIALAARAKVVVSVLATVLHIPNHPAAEVFPVSWAWGTGAVGLDALASVVVAPMAEECLFRGVLLNWLTTWMRPVTAILVSALVFGVGHLYYGAGMLVPTLYGVVLAWMRLRTGQLRAGIALHVLINAVATTVLLTASR